MKKKYYVILGVLIFLSLIVIFFINRKRDFLIEYKIDGYEVEESYHVDGEYYHYIIKTIDHDFPVSIESKYKSKKLIKNIEVIEDENAVCAVPKSDKLDFFPLCYDENKYVDSSLLDVEIDTDIETYDQCNIEIDNIKFSNTLGLNYAIWNHKGYYYINDDTSDRKEFLDEDEYYNNHAFIIDKYLLTPNYDEEYNFTSMYILNLEKNKLDTWDLDYEISYNFYYMGIHEGKVYLLDRKNKIEYSLDPKRKKIEIVSKDENGKVFDEKWGEVSLTKLASDDYIFVSSNAYNYKLIDNTLYLDFANSDIDMQTSIKKVTKIVGTKDDMVFYLVKNKLYVYSPYYKEVLLAEYSEWEFNDINAIFVY